MIKIKINSLKDILSLYPDYYIQFRVENFEDDEYNMDYSNLEEFEESGYDFFLELGDYELTNLKIDFQTNLIKILYLRSSIEDFDFIPYEKSTIDELIDYFNEYKDYKVSLSVSLCDFKTTIQNIKSISYDRYNFIVCNSETKVELELPKKIFITHNIQELSFSFEQNFVSYKFLFEKDK